MKDRHKGMFFSEKNPLPEEIEPIRKNQWYANNYIFAGILFLGVIGGIAKYNLREEPKKINPLESYLCIEPVPLDEGTFEDYAKVIKWMSGVKIGEPEIIDFMIKRENGIERISDEKYLNLPVYSRDVCGRLYGLDKSKWPK